MEKLQHRKTKPATFNLDMNLIGKPTVLYSGTGVDVKQPSSSARVVSAGFGALWVWLGGQLPHQYPHPCSNDKQQL